MFRLLLMTLQGHRQSASRCSYGSSSILNCRGSGHSNCRIICNRCGILYAPTNSLTKSQNRAVNNYRGTSNYYGVRGLQVERQQQRARLRGFVMKSDWKPLLSGFWFEKLCLNWPEIYMMIKGKSKFSWRIALPFLSAGWEMGHHRQRWESSLSDANQG